MKASIKNIMLSVALTAMMPFYGCKRTEYIVVPTGYYATPFPTKLFNCNNISAADVVGDAIKRKLVYTLISVEQFDKKLYSEAETEFPKAKIFGYKVRGQKKDAGYIYLLVLDSNNISLPVMKKEMKLLEKLALGCVTPLQNKVPSMATNSDSLLEKSVDSYNVFLPDSQMNILHISMPKNYHPAGF